MGYSWGNDPEYGIRAFAEAARFIASQPDGVYRLLSVHHSDPNGLCDGCGRPGSGVAYIAWPCPIALLAQAAGQKPHQ